MKADTMNQIKEIALSVVVLKNEEFNTSGEQLTVADVHVHHAESDDTIKGSFSSNSASSEVSTTYYILIHLSYLLLLSFFNFERHEKTLSNRVGLGGILYKLILIAAAIEVFHFMTKYP